MFKFQDFGQTDLLKKLELYENSNRKFTANVGKYKITYGAGGAHYGKKGIWKGQILNIDFASLYPHIMVNYKLYSRKIKNPEKIKELMIKRLEYKKQNDPKANSLKIIINSIFGASGDVNSSIYDPEACYSVCACGQIIITYLMDTLKYFGEILNCNTDGIYFLYDEKSMVELLEVEETIKAIANIVNIPVEISHYHTLIQRDVNNYVAIADNNTLTSKGSIWKPKNLLDNNCPIIYLACVNYILHNDYKNFINQNEDLQNFQIIVRKSSKFVGLYHNFVSPENKLNNTNRVFASKNQTGTILKVKKGKVYKYSDLPENVFIDNGDIRGKKVTFDLDKSWYIKKVEKILEDWELKEISKLNYELHEFM